MPTDHATTVLQQVRRAVLGDGADLSDGQLLGCYIERGEQDAFAALVKRHGPMVWGVCRRVLHRHQDAEDAFQATFLVLFRKAASIVPREMLGNWLYGVAYQTAVRVRSMNAKRWARERQVREMPEPEAVEQDLWNNLQPLLDQELARLPDKYRLPVVLCDLEGKTYEAAARQLGCPAGTFAARLSRARAMLAKRLRQRGIALSGGALAAVLLQKVASAGVPTSVVSSTIKAASQFAAGAAAGGAISVKVAALAEGVLKAMLFTKLRAALAVVLILGFVATGATILTCRMASGQDDKKPTAEKPVEPAGKKEKEKEIVTAWGKEINGLQAGLGFRSGEKRAYHYGETVTLVVRVRNVGKNVVKFSYLQPFIEHSPTVTDSDGKPVPQPNVIPDIGERDPGMVKLPPAKEIELHEMKRQLKPASESGSKKVMQPYALYGTGKVSVQYEQVLGTPSMGLPGWKLDPALSKLATGKLELEIKPNPPTPANEFPVGWGGGGGNDYEIRVDRRVRHGGKASGSIKSFTTTPLWYGALTQAFKADKFRGRRLRMTAYVKSKDVENSAGLWMRIEGFDGKGNYSLASDLMRTPIKGTTDWKRYEVVLDVPKEGAGQIYFGVMLAGKGQVWADDFKFEAVGKDVKTTGGRIETGKASGGPLKRLPTEPKNLDFEQ